MEHYTAIAEQKVREFSARFTFPMKPASEPELSRNTELIVSSLLLVCLLHSFVVRRFRTLLHSLLVVLFLASTGISSVVATFGKDFSAFFDATPLWYLGLSAAIIYLSDVTATLVYGSHHNFLVSALVAVTISIGISIPLDLAFSASGLVAFAPKNATLVLLGIPVFDLVFYWVCIQGAFTAGKALAYSVWTHPRWWAMPVFVPIEALFMYLAFYGLGIAVLATQRAGISQQLMLLCLIAALVFITGIALGQSKTVMAAHSSSVVHGFLHILPSLMVAMLTFTASTLVTASCASAVATASSAAAAEKKKDALVALCTSGQLQTVLIIISAFVCMLTCLPVFLAKRVHPVTPVSKKHINTKN